MADVFLKLGGDGVSPTKSGQENHRTIIFISVFDPQKIVFSSAKDDHHSRFSTSAIVCHFSGHPADIQLPLAMEKEIPDEPMASIVDLLSTTVSPLCDCTFHSESNGTSHIPFNFAGIQGTH